MSTNRRDFLKGSTSLSLIQLSHSGKLVGLHGNERLTNSTTLLRHRQLLVIRTWLPIFRISLAVRCLSKPVLASRTIDDMETDQMLDAFAGFEAELHTGAGQERHALDALQIRRCAARISSSRRAARMDSSPGTRRPSGATFLRVCDPGISRASRLLAESQFLRGFRLQP
jgi:hypothetical protein